MNADDVVFSFKPDEPVHFDGAGNVTMTLSTFNGLLREMQRADRAEAALATCKAVLREVLDEECGAGGEAACFWHHDEHDNRCDGCIRSCLPREKRARAEEACK